VDAAGLAAAVVERGGGGIRGRGWLSWLWRPAHAAHHDGARLTVRAMQLLADLGAQDAARGDSDGGDCLARHAATPALASAVAAHLRPPRHHDAAVAAVAVLRELAGRRPAVVAPHAASVAAWAGAARAGGDDDAAAEAEAVVGAVGGVRDEL
jgi:hypothetical protein